MAKEPTRRNSKRRETRVNPIRLWGSSDHCSLEDSKGKASSVLYLTREGKKDERMVANALLHLVHRARVDGFRREQSSTSPVEEPTPKAESSQYSVSFLSIPFASDSQHFLTSSRDIRNKQEFSLERTSLLRSHLGLLILSDQISDRQKKKSKIIADDKPRVNHSIQAATMPHKHKRRQNDSK